jgi:hypothetical protein
VGTKYHVTCPIDYVVIWISSNIVEEEVHRLFCGNGGLGLAGAMALRATRSLLSTVLA